MQSIELRTGIGTWWSVEWQQEVFACVWEFEAYVAKLISESDMKHDSISEAQFLQAFSRIDASSWEFRRVDGNVRFEDDAVLVYNGNTTKLIEDILAL